MLPAKQCLTTDPDVSITVFEVNPSVPEDVASKILVVNPVKRPVMASFYTNKVLAKQ